MNKYIKFAVLGVLSWLLVLALMILRETPLQR